MTIAMLRVIDDQKPESIAALAAATGRKPSKLSRTQDGRMITTIFRSRLHPESVEAYRILAGRMLELARSMPGFRSFKTFTADDGERVSVIEFDSLRELDAWRDHPEHKEAQALGRAKFYAEYRIDVCTPVRSYEHRLED